MCPFHYFDYNDIPTASKKAAALIKQMGTPEYVFCSHRPCFIFLSNGNIVFWWTGHLSSFNQQMWTLRVQIDFFTRFKIHICPYWSQCYICHFYAIYHSSPIFYITHPTIFAIISVLYSKNWTKEVSFKQTDNSSVSN